MFGGTKYVKNKILEKMDEYPRMYVGDSKTPIPVLSILLNDKSQQLDFNAIFWTNGDPSINDKYSIDEPYVGDIKRNSNASTFDELVPFNSVIIDVSSDEGTLNLLSCLLKNKIYIPLIIGTTELCSDTLDLIKEYSTHTKVVHITNFSKGIPLIREFAKISNSLDIDWNFNLTDIDCINKKDFPGEVKNPYLISLICIFAQS